MATLSKNLNIGSWRTLGVFAPSLAVLDSGVALPSAELSSQNLDCHVMGGNDLLGGDMMGSEISGSPEGRPEASISHRVNYQTEYGPPIVSSRDALKRIPN